VSERESTVAELYRERWRPSRGWAEVVRPAFEALRGGAVGLAAADAWAELAMMLGDTRAAPLCAFVCLHASSLLPPGVEHRRLEAHLQLALVDLGLAASADGGPLPLGRMGDADLVRIASPALAAWLERELAPFGGDLAAAAAFALDLAAERTGVTAGS
jgi:hypothetical protein